MNIEKVEAVCVGAKFCECGGMMQLKKGGGKLMCNPPKVEIVCPFCGSSDYHLYPYNVEISFKKA